MVKLPDEQRVAVITMRVTPTFKSRLKTEADRRNIDMTALVSLVMSKWLERHGARPLARTSLDELADHEPGYDDVDTKLTHPLEADESQTDEG